MLAARVLTIQPLKQAKKVGETCFFKKKPKKYQYIEFHNVKLIACRQGGD